MKGYCFNNHATELLHVGSHNHKNLLPNLKNPDVRRRLGLFRPDVRREDKK
ncbi:hypothetical protein LTSEADE_3979 [Salmonella enterica subsp. enterica serovar Adelaide str. A4-669]|uniref:Uncharacterized protein n=4 Tax=Salmonella enterica I TaxID=59201 RepID=A0A6C8GJW5_SALET|nr:hypothetical protein LTSEADE_3979 [Salmonella enterica subsp. enterica serovar Adelaide str. A4-669]